MQYAGAPGVIAADLCPHTRAAGISDKSRVLISLVGIGGPGIPTAGPAAVCSELGTDSWQRAARDLGFDLYLVHYADPMGHTQRQAFAVAALIQRLQVEGKITPAADVALVGVSWGGLIGRYALQHMETHGPAHNVDLWITGDSPLQGAYVPIGIQHAGHYFGTDLGVKSAANAMAEMLDAPATKQLLIYHYTRTGQSGPTWAPEFTALFTTELKNALGGFPHASGLRRVGVSDGRADGGTDSPRSGEQILGWRSDNVDVVGSSPEVTTTYGTTTIRVRPSGGSWRIRVTTTTPGVLGIPPITLFDHTYVWAITARVEVRAKALPRATSGLLFDARPIFTLNRKELDLLNANQVKSFIKPLIEAEIPALARGVWDQVAETVLDPLARGIAAGAKAETAKYPWMKYRSVSVDAPYSYDGGPGGRTNKTGVVSDLLSASGIGILTGTTVRDHSFIPIHSALMLDNTLGVPFDPASVAAGRGQAPKTPFDRIVYSPTNLAHLATKSLFPATTTSELMDLVDRSGG